jgi:hypothetical protein
MPVALSLKIAMAVRAQDCLHSWPAGGPPADPLTKRFTDLAFRAQALLQLQEREELASKALTRSRRVLRRQILGEPLRRVFRIVRAVAISNPGLLRDVREPAYGRTEGSFRASVEAIVRSAESHWERFLQHGMQPEHLEELHARVREYDQAVGDTSTTPPTAADTGVALRAVTRELLRYLKKLDNIALRRLRGRPDLMRAWSEARRIAWQPRGDSPIVVGPPAHVMPAA